MSSSLSLDTEVTLLLTAPLSMVGRKRKHDDSPRRLTPSEYAKLTQGIRDCGRQLGDLIGPKGAKILDECQTGLETSQVQELLARGFQLSQVLEHWRARSIWVVSQADQDYPSRVRQKLGSAAPPVIYGCGDRELLELGGLAVVGSRRVSDQVLEYAEQTGRSAVQANCTIVSGGARGVDQAAMRGALEGGGAAIGVLADGLEKSVMQRENRDVLMDGRLTLISPFDPRAGFAVGNAMRRNKLIYALADAGLVVESDYKKGGTWTGAAEQLKKLRSVPFYARVDGPSSKGLEALLTMGARPWPNPQTPDDFRMALSGTQVYSEAESLWKSAFQTADSGAAGSTNTDSAELPGLHLLIEGAHFNELPASEALFKCVEELLRSLDTPTSESDVAAFLQVSATQAREWLKRLVTEGKYKRSIRPVRYDRTL